MVVYKQIQANVEPRKLKPSPPIIHFLSNLTVQSLTIMGFCHITLSLNTTTVFKLSQSSPAMTMMDLAEKWDNERD